MQLYRPLRFESPRIGLISYADGIAKNRINQKA